MKAHYPTHIAEHRREAATEAVLEYRRNLSESYEKDGVSGTEFKDAIKRHFGSKSDKIISMLDAEETDGAITIIHRALLSSVIAAITNAENMLMESGGARGVYAFNNLITQCRELVADIQAGKQAQEDMLLIADLLGEQVNIRLRGVAQAVVDIQHTLKRSVNDSDYRDSYVDSATKDIATVLSNTNTDIQNIIRERLASM